MNKIILTFFVLIAVLALTDARSSHKVSRCDGDKNEKNTIKHHDSSSSSSSSSSEEDDDKCNNETGKKSGDSSSSSSSSPSSSSEEDCDNHNEVNPKKGRRCH